MVMMRYVLMYVLFVVLLPLSGTCQSIYFPTREGMVLEYELQDGEGRTIGYSRETIRQVTGTPDDLTIVYSVEMLNPKMKREGESEEYTVRIVKGEMVFDLSALLKNVEEKVEVEGEAPKYPVKFAVGQKLEDYSCKLKIEAEGMKITTEMKTTDRKVTAKESIPVSGKTLVCFKLDEIVTTEAMGFTNESKHSTWFAEGIGMVKMDVFDAEGNLESRQILIAVK